MGLIFILHSEVGAIEAVGEGGVIEAMGEGGVITAPAEANHKKGVGLKATQKGLESNPVASGSSRHDSSSERGSCSGLLDLHLTTTGELEQGVSKGPHKTSKRRAPSNVSSNSSIRSNRVVNLADLSPTILHNMEKAAKIAEKEQPAIAAAASKRGKERHAAAEKERLAAEQNGSKSSQDREAAENTRSGQASQCVPEVTGPVKPRDPRLRRGLPPY